MTFFATICLISVLLSGFTGIFVLFGNRKSPLNQSWFFFDIFIMIWLIGLAGTMDVDTKQKALIFQKILYLGTIFIPVFFLYFCGIITGGAGRAKKILKINLVLAGFFLILLLGTSLFIKSISDKTSFGYYPFEVGVFYYLFLLWFAVLTVYGFATLVKGAKNEKIDSARRQQIVIMFWANLLGFSVGSLNFLLDFNIVISPIYNLIFPFYLLFVAYGIVRKQLFGIKLILTEALVGLMGVLLLFAVFFMPTQESKILISVIFILFCAIGYLLIKATLREVEQKEVFAGMVQERTKELEQSKKIAEERAAELEKWYNLTIGRELRMAELKEKIKEMEEKPK